MREIEFRGKTKQGNWVYGVPVKSRTNCENWYIELVKAIEYETDLEYSTYVESEEIDENTLGQYTGLKDKNGKKIFEGDIVIFNKGRNLPNYTAYPELIKFHQRDCAFQRYPFGKQMTTGGAGKLIQSDMISECEVIGNIYDNPELVEGRDD